MRGEDYDFQFSGRVREGKLQFRLNLEYVGDDSQQDSESREPEKQRYALVARRQGGFTLVHGINQLQHAIKANDFGPYLRASHQL